MIFRSHIARNTILWAFVAIMTSTTRSESDTSEAFATVRQYIDAFNKGDVKAMSSLFAPSGAILDGMAPHLWQGPTAAQDWYKDVLTEGDHLGASGYFVTLGEPRHVNVTDNAAYVVVPATMTFKLRGQQVTQTGASYVVALRRLPEGWRIAAWAWAKGASK